MRRARAREGDSRHRARSRDRAARRTSPPTLLSLHTTHGAGRTLTLSALARHAHRRVGRWLLLRLWWRAASSLAVVPGRVPRRHRYVVVQDADELYSTVSTALSSQLKEATGLPDLGGAGCVIKSARTNQLVAAKPSATRDDPRATDRARRARTCDVVARRAPRSRRAERPPGFAHASLTTLTTTMLCDRRCSRCGAPARGGRPGGGWRAGGRGAATCWTRCSGWRSRRASGGGI